MKTLHEQENSSLIENAHKSFEDELEKRRDKIGRLPFFEEVRPKFGIARKDRRAIKRKMEKQSKRLSNKSASGSYENNH